MMMRLKNNRLKINIHKLEVLVTERNDNAKVKVMDTIGVELKQVKRFKYLGMEIAIEDGQ